MLPSAGLNENIARVLTLRDIQDVLLTLCYFSLMVNVSSEMLLSLYIVTLWL